jgi:hypothetical protein
MTARSEAHAADAAYRDSQYRYRIGDRVRTSSGDGVIEFIAYSTATESPIYTVDINSRIRLRLRQSDLRPIFGGMA